MMRRKEKKRKDEGKRGRDWEKWETRRRRNYTK
jgi:hypothetical protein